MEYTTLNKNELEKNYNAVKAEYDALKAKGMKLDMSRGKPCTQQLDLSAELFSTVKGDDCFVDNFDLRNYGLLDGIPSCKKLFAELLDVNEDQLFIGGNSSLTLMYCTLATAYTNGLRGSTPWAKLDKVKFLCPAPGYDRHFAITQSLGAELITVPMTDNGPDMDVVEELVKDPAVKGIWCVPKYSNPTGVIYSDEVVNRLASMKPAADDFVIMWDNAYIVHEIEGEYVPFVSMVKLCEEKGNPNMVFEFCSTSKITLPGAGVSAVASSVENMKYISKQWGYMTISYDKINQLRHVRFLENKENIIALMKKHAEIMLPKFKAFTNKFDEELKGLGIAQWTEPKGGYFISFDALPGCAKRIVSLMKEAGIVLTGAGATYPYGVDPEDKNIRIAPSLPPLEEIVVAAEAMCICVKLASLEKLLEK